MADANTITRIGGILKNVYGPKIEEQQNKTAVLRTRYGKADNEYVRSMAGDHFEFPARVGGNRAGVAPAASDDPLPTAGRQNEKKFQVFDRGYTAVIKMYEKDILNSESNPQAFANHQTNEMTQIVTDTEKVINIDIAAGDGSGILSTIAAGTASATQTLAVGTAFGQFGSRYLQVNDVVDVYSSNLVTSRTAGAGVSVTSITPSTAGGPATVVFSATMTTTTGDIVVRGAGRVNKAYTGFWAATNNQGVTFQGLSTTTYPLLQSNLIAAAGNYLNEGYLQQLITAINVASGQEMDEFVASHSQFDQYEALGFAQKRFTDSTLDKGYETLTFKGKKFVKDVDVPPAAIYGVTRDTVKFGQVAGLNFSELDGKVLKWVPGYAAYTAYMREYGNFVFTHPNQLGCISGLGYNTSSTAYAR